MEECTFLWLLNIETNGTDIRKPNIYIFKNSQFHNDVVIYQSGVFVYLNEVMYDIYTDLFYFHLQTDRDFFNVRFLHIDNPKVYAIFRVPSESWKILEKLPS